VAAETGVIAPRTCPRWGGALLAALGIVGFFAGTRLLALNSDTIHDLFHIAAGVLLLWVGRRASAEQALIWTRVLASVFLLLGLAAFIDPYLFGVFTFSLSLYDTLLHLLYGVVGIWAGWRSPSPA
jgi:hypothetical protein